MRVALLLRCLTPFLVLLAGCSATTLRHDTLSDVEIDDRDITVSWVQVPPNGIDLIVGAAPAADDKPLELAAAQRAAERVAGRHCLFDRVHAAFPAVQYPGAQFAFRYVCGGGAPAEK
jgi:hypothetical protein